MKVCGIKKNVNNCVFIGIVFLLFFLVIFFYKKKNNESNDNVYISKLLDDPTQKRSIKKINKEEIIQSDSRVEANNSSVWYGVRWSENIGGIIEPINSVGFDELHTLLPIQNRMRRCLIKDGVFVAYLDSNNSLFREDGAKAVLDGTDGDVCVELPEFYYQFSDSYDNDFRTITLKISETPISGFSYSPKMYIGAYEATIDRVENELVSVCTTDFDIYQLGKEYGEQWVSKIKNYSANAARYRGGDNNSLFDSLEINDINYWRNNIGRPVAGLSRDEYRVLGDKEKRKFMYLYDAHKALWILSFVEFRDRNIQHVLGEGATVWPDYSSFKQWTKDGTESIIPCGVTNSLGNKSGHVLICLEDAPVGYDENGQFVRKDVWVPCVSYRGVEHYWGHLYKTLDQINVWVKDTGGIRQKDNKNIYNVLYSYQRNPFNTDNNFRISEFVDVVTFCPMTVSTSSYYFGIDGHILPIESSAEYGYIEDKTYCDAVECWNWNGTNTQQVDVNGSLINHYYPGRNMFVSAFSSDGKTKRNSNGTRITYVLN